jgi:hypothetical protein
MNFHEKSIKFRMLTLFSPEFYTCATDGKTGQLMARKASDFSILQIPCTVDERVRSELNATDRTRGWVMGITCSTAEVYFCSFARSVSRTAQKPGGIAEQKAFGVPQRRRLHAVPLTWTFCGRSTGAHWGV